VKKRRARKPNPTGVVLMGQALEDIQWTHRDSLKDQQDILSIGKNSRNSKESRISKNLNLRNSV
jgi:hypothetical protein